MRFLADMGISQSVVKSLNDQDHDAIHLISERLNTLEDDRILEKARDENRIVLTHDLDFGELLALQGVAAPSVITFRLSDMRPLHVLSHLTAALEEFRQELETGAAVVITDQRARCRLLPIGGSKS